MPLNIVWQALRLATFFILICVAGVAFRVSLVISDLYRGFVTGVALGHILIHFAWQPWRSWLGLALVAYLGTIGRR